MRRFKQELGREECEKLLAEAKSGVLALSGDMGYPYAVPVNHVYKDGKIYFHCAVSGHKIDAIKRNDKVSFCVVAKDEVLPKERATSYLSVMVFGRAKIIEDEEELRRISRLIGNKFSPDYPEDCEEEINDTIARGTLCCVEITAEHISGKCSLDILKERENN